MQRFLSALDGLHGLPRPSQAGATLQVTGAAAGQTKKGDKKGDKKERAAKAEARKAKYKQGELKAKKGGKAPTAEPGDVPRRQRKPLVSAGVSGLRWTLGRAGKVVTHTFAHVPATLPRPTRA